MTREELAAVRDVIDALLRCPDHVRELLTQGIAPQARWLAPEARSKERTVPLIFSKPNGRDPHPPQAASTGKASEETDGFSPRRSPTPYAGKARHRRPPISAKAAEQQLMATLRDNPGASVNALAKAAGANPSSTGERLRGLASRGVVTKDSAGHWRLVAELAERPRAQRCRRRADGGTGTRAPRSSTGGRTCGVAQARLLRPARTLRVSGLAIRLRANRTAGFPRTPPFPLRFSVASSRALRDFPA